MTLIINTNPHVTLKQKLRDATLYSQMKPKYMFSDATLCYNELPDETNGSVLDAMFNIYTAIP